MSFGNQLIETPTVPAYKANQVFCATPVLPEICKRSTDEKIESNKIIIFEQLFISASD
jgi:hypothetical protein